MHEISNIIASAKNFQPTTQKLEVLSMEDVELSAIEWLWPKRIALGKLTVIAGQPGLGKSQITAFLCATVTTGGAWPNQEGRAPIGDAVILSAEDDPADTIKPRLIAAWANVASCYVIRAVISDEQEKKSQRSFTLEADIERLAALLDEKPNIRLIIIDPISAYMGKVDSHKNSDVRGLLAPLSEMAAKYRVAVVMVTHFNKSVTQDVMGRVIGSIGLVAAARAAYAVVRDEGEHEKRYLLPLKNNIGNDTDGFAYKIKGLTIQNGIETSFVEWLPGLINAKSILNPEPKAKGGTNGAGEFLADLLSNGPVKASEIFGQAEGMGYSKGAMQRAARRVGVRRDKDGFDGGWLWSLQGNGLRQDTEDDEGNVSYNMTSSTPSQSLEDVNYGGNNE